MAKAKPSKDELSTLATLAEQHQRKLNDYLDRAAAEMKQQFPTLPIGVLRMELVAGMSNCPCNAVRNLHFKQTKEEDNG